MKKQTNKIILEKLIDEIIKVVVKNYRNLLQYVQSQKETLDTLHVHVQSLMVTLPENKKTYKNCKLAVINYSNSLQYVRLFEDKKTDEICKLAVQNNLVRLSEEKITFVRNIIEDKIIKLVLAVQNNIIWSDEMIKYAIKCNCVEVLQDMPIENITDEIIKLAVQNNSKALGYIPIEKLSDEICMLAVKNNYKALGYIPIEKSSNEICMLAVQNNYKAFQYVPKNKTSDEIIKIAVKNNSKVLRYVPIEKMSEEIIKLALKNNGYVIIHVPIEKMSEEIIKLALENNSYILLHIPESKITDDIINFVIEKDGYNYNILQYLPIEKMPSDLITYEPIHKDRAILIHKQLYDAKSLYKYIESNRNATIPHNREPFTQEMLQDIYNKSNYV